MPNKIIRILLIKLCLVVNHQINCCDNQVKSFDTFLPTSPSLGRAPSCNGWGQYADVSEMSSPIATPEVRPNSPKASSEASPVAVLPRPSSYTSAPAARTSKPLIPTITILTKRLAALARINHTVS